MAAMDLRDSRPSSEFGFLHGEWTVRHRKLRRRLSGDDRWIEFGGTMSCRPVLAGAGNFDENRLDDPDGAYHACTLRLRDPASGQWSIFWIDGRRLHPDPPVTGRFDDGEGRFSGEDVHEGRPILVRFVWSRLDGPSPRWEQAFSADGGAAWETNWIMDFDRAAGTGGESGC
jgi:hypothetical protein